jgi:hypothetical protein
MQCNAVAEWQKGREGELGKDCGPDYANTSWSGLDAMARWAGAKRSIEDLPMKTVENKVGETTPVLQQQVLRVLCPRRTLAVSSVPAPMSRIQTGMEIT